MSEPEEKVDLMEIPDGEKIRFSDNADGTPADAPADPPETPKADEPPADPPADPDGEPPADPPPDDKPKPQRKGKDYQKRINELVRKAHEETEARAAAETRAKLLEEQLAETRKKRQTESDETLSRREQDAAARKKAAIERGDMVAYDAAMSELLDVRLQRTERAEEPAKPAAKPEPKADAEIHPSAVTWKTRNKWFDFPENSHLAREVVNIQNRLIRDGEQFGDDLYRKIDEELESLPEFDQVRGIATDDAPERPADTPQRPRSTVSPPTRADAPPARPKPGEVTEKEVLAMKRLGLNLKDPKVRAAYLARKSKSA